MIDIIKCTMNDDIIKEAIKAAYYAGYKACHNRYQNYAPMNEKEELEKIWETLGRKVFKLITP